MREVNEIIMESVYSRLEEIGSDVLLVNPKYIEISEKRTDIFNQLKELIPEEKKSLIMEVSDLISGEVAIIDEVMYLQGIKDALKMKDMLG